MRQMEFECWKLVSISDGIAGRSALLHALQTYTHTHTHTHTRFPVSLSLSLSLSHTHTHARTDTHTHTHPHANTNTENRRVWFRFCGPLPLKPQTGKEDQSRVNSSSALARLSLLSFKLKPSKLGLICVLLCQLSTRRAAWQMGMNEP